MGTPQMRRPLCPLWMARMRVYRTSVWVSSFFGSRETILRLSGRRRHEQCRYANGSKRKLSLSIIYSWRKPGSIREDERSFPSTAERARSREPCELRLALGRNPGATVRVAKEDAPVVVDSDGRLRRSGVARRTSRWRNPAESTHKNGKAMRKVPHSECKEGSNIRGSGRIVASG